MAAAAATRTAALVERLDQLDDEALAGPSELEGWNRLTIVCHLRYGASALLRMTQDVVAGRETAYYPDGRAQQRPGTLSPLPGESPGHVVSSLAAIAAELDDLWSRLHSRDWAREIVEPPANRDLGSVPLARLALSRLLEVEVHGTDLGIGLPDWSPLLVEVALPTRLHWLATRRTNHRDFARSLRGSWLLAADDGPTWLVSVDGELVKSRPAHASSEHPSSVIEGTSRDLLALLLGRPPLQALRVTGDVAFGASFSAAFPGP